MKSRKYSWESEIPEPTSQALANFGSEKDTFIKRSRIVSLNVIRQR